MTAALPQAAPLFHFVFRLAQASHPIAAHCRSARIPLEIPVMRRLDVAETGASRRHRAARSCATATRRDEVGTGIFHSVKTNLENPLTAILNQELLTGKRMTIMEMVSNFMMRFQ
jgi:hypothetical protein